ncbi:MAG TPA: DUF72 domain-containing protein [Bryobacteraceae bacterium]|jgi:uncharacterized protein YecE (DUF72 family)
MSQQASLFGDTFNRRTLADRVRVLGRDNIFIGTSSWRYEGWLGQIYTPERYYSRGRFSKKKFHEECIEEYAETFPVVGGDFSFYAIPEPAFWNKLFDRSPAHLKWSLKVPEDFTAKHFSRQPRYGDRRGLLNPAYLDQGLFEAGWLKPLAPYFDRISVMIFEFGTFSKADYAEPAQFFDDLDVLLRRLPRSLRYCVEIRNDDYLQAQYLDVLRSNGVAHTLSSWSRMPSLREQLLIEDIFTAPHSVARALLRPGRGYDQAVKLFSPYHEVKEEYPAARDALRELISRSRREKRMAYIHINNRLEGNAIGTIDGTLERGEL